MKTRCEICGKNKPKTMATLRNLPKKVRMMYQIDVEKNFK